MECIYQKGNACKFDEYSDICNTCTAKNDKEPTYNYSREIDIRHQAYKFGNDDYNIPEGLKGNVMANVAIKNAFAAGAHWSDEHPSHKIVKKIVDLSYEYISSTPDVTELTEEGELEYILDKLKDE